MPKIWLSSPDNIRNYPSHTYFLSKLKTHLLTLHFVTISCFTERHIVRRLWAMDGGAIANLGDMIDDMIWGGRGSRLGRVGSTFGGFVVCPGDRRPWFGVGMQGSSPRSSRTICHDNENKALLYVFVWQAICRRNDFVEKERIHKVRASRKSFDWVAYNFSRVVSPSDAVKLSGDATSAAAERRKAQIPLRRLSRNFPGRKFRGSRRNGIWA